MSIDNTSGQGEYATVPEEICRWNWGAFWLTWIWGIGNKCYIALLALLPIGNIIMPFYLGSKGNELAWRNAQWADSNDLLMTQKKWAKAGWLILTFLLLIIIGNIWGNYNKQQFEKPLENKVMYHLQSNQEIIDYIGTQDMQIMALGSTFYRIGYAKETLSGYTIIVRTPNDRILVQAEFDKEENVTSITLTRGNATQKTIKLK